MERKGGFSDRVYFVAKSFGWDSLVTTVCGNRVFPVTSHFDGMIVIKYVYT